MTLPFLTTSDDTGHLNKPDEFDDELRETCAQLGRELVRLCLANEQPEDLCGDCAFRLGSEPNRSVTAHNALVTIVNGGTFFCHHGENRVCAGFSAAMRKRKQ